MSALPRVALIATGGTIDSLGTSRLDLAFYTEAQKRLPEGQLVAGLPELQSIAQIEELPFRRVPSHALQARDWYELASLAASALNGRHDGVVITHGTNTLDETAFALQLTATSPKPVVLTGAMRPAESLGSDGQLNLLRAVQVAASPEAVGKGVLVVLNDTILSARDVVKTATFRVETFAAPGTGPLGYADADGRVVFYHDARAELGPRFEPAALLEMPRVDIVVSHVGADGLLIDAAVAAGASGIVCAGTGAGRSTPAEDEALERAIGRGVVVCQATRVSAGRVARSPLMTRRGVVAAEHLPSWKARVLLGLALTKTHDPDVIQQWFDRA